MPILINIVGISERLIESLMVDFGYVVDRIQR